MIHGIYLKSKPKLDLCKQQAIQEGNDRAEVAVQIFESAFWIPEYVTEIKEQKPQFN